MEYSPPPTRKPDGAAAGAPEQHQAPAAAAETAHMGTQQHAYDTLGGIYAASYTDLVRFAYRWTGNYEMAEDATSQAVVRALGSTALQNGTVTPRRSGLYTILRNVLIDDYRREARKPSVSLEYLREAAQFDPADPTTAPHHMPELPETGEELASLLSQLPLQQQQAVRLRLLTGLSLKDTAAAMGVTVDNVKTLQHRGMARLKRLGKAGQAAV